MLVNVESGNMVTLSDRLCPEFATRGTGRKMLCHFTETEGNSLFNIGNIRRLRKAPSKFDAYIEDDDDDVGTTGTEEDTVDSFGAVLLYCDPIGTY